MYAKIINNETKLCEVGTGTNTKFYESIGMVEMDVEQAWNGAWYVKGYAPERPAPTRDEISAQRQARYIAESDSLKMDYDEAVARGAENADELKAAWLAKKDEIRADLPYPDAVVSDLEITDASTETAGE